MGLGARKAIQSAFRGRPRARKNRLQTTKNCYRQKLQTTRSRRTHCLRPRQRWHTLGVGSRRSRYARHRNRIKRSVGHSAHNHPRKTLQTNQRRKRLHSCPRYRQQPLGMGAQPSGATHWKRQLLSHPETNQPFHRHQNQKNSRNPRQLYRTRHQRPRLGLGQQQLRKTRGRRHTAKIPHSHPHSRKTQICRNIGRLRPHGRYRLR